MEQKTEQKTVPMINIEVAYATPERQKIIKCKVAEGTTVLDAAKQSGITDIFLDLDLDNADFGSWSKPKPATSTVTEGQRIEIYRPLLADPKESRRKRAEKSPRRERRERPNRPERAERKRRGRPERKPKEETKKEKE